VKKYNNILVIGLGMMGASLCKSIKKNKISNNLMGYDINQKSASYALENKIIDIHVNDFKNMMHPDIIILCTPIGTYINLINDLIRSVSKNTILTDIGSSKGLIHNKIYRIILNSNIKYLSSHPMVGSEKSGIIHRKNDMYKNKIIFIIDKLKTSKATYSKVNTFWKSLGSITHNISKNEHDILMSQTSHISHVMAYIFMQSLPQKVIDENLSLLLGGGIKEHVRLSKSDPEMWADIFINNKNNINKTINKIQKNISNLKNLIDTSDKNQLKALLKKIQSKTK
tara:strand:- start:3971 stop:4819 length:849 start_codon:yes stop_codon:yes gene_type:complete